MVKILIIHSWKDKIFSKKLAAFILKEGNNFKVYYTVRSYNINLSIKIKNKLEWCDKLILVWSKKLAKSSTLKLVLNYALEKKIPIISCFRGNLELNSHFINLEQVDFTNFEKGAKKLSDSLIPKLLFLSEFDESSIELEEHFSDEREDADCAVGPLEFGSSMDFELNKDVVDEIIRSILKESVMKDNLTNLETIIKEEVKKLQFGQILFNPPNVMKVGKKERIEVRIIQNIYDDITRNLKGRGITEIIILKIGTFMKVLLTGENFQIESLNEEEQIVIKDNYTEWSWDVLPLKHGEQFLHLRVTVRMKTPSYEEYIDHPVLDKKILVNVNLSYSIQKFILIYWKWIITVILLPLLVRLIKFIIQK